jgi:hypothetical protein
VERPWSGTTPYLAGSDGGLRPYLWVTLVDRDGQGQIPIIGLVDTGADKSVLPLDYAGLLGYSQDELEQKDVNQVEGSAEAWEAQAPVVAFVNGLEEVQFEIAPLFVATLDALWGRADLMQTFAVTVFDAAQQLTLSLP